MKATDELPRLAFASQSEWEAWLDEHHTDAPGVWLQLAKKDAGIPSVTYDEAVETALCFGWIDGQKAGHDATYWLQRFTPRRPKSVWSRVNREKALALIAAGRMRPAGLRQVELALADGRWDAAYDGQGTITMPPDFQAALDAHPEAGAFFATLNSPNRYAMLRRIQIATTAEKRAARIRQYLDMLSRGEKIYP